MQLELPAEASLLPRTRHAIAGFMEELGGTSDEIDDVLLAVGEACSNVIRHAGGAYVVSVHMSDRDVVVEVIDAGRGFAVQDVEGQIDLRAESGRGLQMIQRLMNQVEVESPTAEGGTRLRMSKRLAATRG